MKIKTVAFSHPQFSHPELVSGSFQILLKLKYLLIIIFISTRILFAQSSGDYNTDELQERLYDRIVAVLSDSTLIELPSIPADKNELLKINKKYYPRAELVNDTLLIPYPARKVQELSHLHYIIPPDFFDKSDYSTCLKPDVNLSFDLNKSTITMNDSYPMTLYRSPRIKLHSQDHIRSAMEYIYEIILPCGFSQIDHKNQIAGLVYFKGYISHEIKLKNHRDLYLLLECLRIDGSVYYYPSKVDDLENNLMIDGLIYIMNEEIPKLYHFGELRMIFNKENSLSTAELKLNLYPFIKSNDTM